MLESPKNAKEQRGEVAHNTTARKGQGSEIVIRLWATDILSVRPDGSGQFLSDYHSVLTRGRLNSYLPQGIWTGEAWEGRWAVHTLRGPRSHSGEHETMVYGPNGFYFPMMRGVEYGWDTASCPNLADLMLGMQAGDPLAAAAFARFCRSKGFKAMAQCAESLSGKRYGERPRNIKSAWEDIAQTSIDARWLADPVTGKLERPLNRADVLLWGVDASGVACEIDNAIWRIVDAATCVRRLGKKGLYAA